MIADQRHRFGAVGILKAIEKEIFSLERTENWDVQLLFEGAGETEEECVREVDDVRRSLVFHPVNELKYFFALKSVLTFQNGNSHLAKHLWIRRDRST